MILPFPARGAERDCGCPKSIAACLSQRCIPTEAGHGIMAAAHPPVILARVQHQLAEMRGGWKRHVTTLMAVRIAKKHVFKTHVKLLWPLHASTKPKPRAGIAQRAWRAPLSILSRADNSRPTGSDIGWNKVGTGGFCKLGAGHSWSNVHRIPADRLEPVLGHSITR